MASEKDMKSQHVKGPRIAVNVVTGSKEEEDRVGWQW
jgi:hypothetical protein